MPLHPGRVLVALVVATAGLAVVAVPAAGTATRSGSVRAGVVRDGVVRDGGARFEVITPSLIRLEYATDGHFEDRPTMTAVRTRRPVPAYSTFVSNGWRVIRTAQLVLRWRRGSGAFDAADLRLRFVDQGTIRTVRPSAGATHSALGGWTRALDLQSGPVPLNPGILTREGWDVLDDTATVLQTNGGAGFAVRPRHGGRYQDWYLFGYGLDYTRALRDLHTLTGPTPLLPRNAFGVWFSKYYAFSAGQVRSLVARFAQERVPLDTLSLDTDFKAVHDPVGAAIAATAAGAPGMPFSWNAWEWNRSLFPDPAGFLAWAHRRGLDVALNIHPSIDSRDSRYAAAVAQAGPLATDNSCLVLQADLTGTCHSFDWTDPKQLAAYFGLHQRFARDGADLFWLDWCCEGSTSAVAPGLTGDTWINQQYARFQRARGERWPAFARIGAGFASDGVDGDRGTGAGGTGAYAEHRNTVQFTGDTCATWPMLAFEAQLTGAEASIGLPYVSHDIGSFNGEPVSGQCQGVSGAISGAHVPDDLYARWVQFATFQPLDRLHSNHGKRLPWEYPAAADRAAADALRLRGALVPYTYTAAAHAAATGLPIVAPLYLAWPGRAAAYRFPSEFSFGPDLVVAPVTTAGDPAPVTLWVPPGTWTERSTGQQFRGPAVRTLQVPLARIPVLVRAGAILTTQPAATHTRAAPNPRLVLTAYPGRRGAAELYDDAGTGSGYQRGRSVRMTLTQTRSGHRETLVIGRARGGFAGAPAARSWTVRFVGVLRPQEVLLDGIRLRHAAIAGQRGWRYDAATRTLTVWTGRVATAVASTIVAGS